MSYYEKASGPSAKCYVYDSIRTQILDEVLCRGCRLREADIAKKHSTSRTPVRRALMALARDGLVEHRPGKGWFVTSLQPADARDIIAVRAMLEAQAAGLATAELGPPEHEELERTLAGMDTALSSGDCTLFSSLNRQFHTTIYRACPNKRLVGMLEDLLKDFPNLGFRTIREGADQRQREHYRILEAIIARMQDRVNKLVYSHFVEHFAHLAVDGAPKEGGRLAGSC